MLFAAHGQCSLIFLIIKSTRFNGSEIELNPCIEAIKQKLKDLALPRREDTAATILPPISDIRVKAMKMTRAIAMYTSVVHALEKSWADSDKDGLHLMST